MTLFIVLELILLVGMFDSFYHRRLNMGLGFFVLSLLLLALALFVLFLQWLFAALPVL